MTLIELMTALAVVAILAAIGYPSYMSAVRNAKRAEGKNALMQLMQQEERYYSQHNSYVAFDSASANGAATSFKWYSGNSAASSAYEIKADTCTPGGSLSNCIRLRAMPGTAKVDGSFTDTECGTLSLDSTGATGAGAGSCWN